MVKKILKIWLTTSNDRTDDVLSICQATGEALLTANKVMLKSYGWQDNGTDDGSVYDSQQFRCVYLSGIKQKKIPVILKIDRTKERRVSLCWSTGHSPVLLLCLRRNKGVIKNQAASNNIKHNNLHSFQIIIFTSLRDICSNVYFL